MDETKEHMVRAVHPMGTFLMGSCKNTNLKELLVRP